MRAPFGRRVLLYRRNIYLPRSPSRRLDGAREERARGREFVNFYWTSETFALFRDASLNAARHKKGEERLKGDRTKEGDRFLFPRFPPSREIFSDRWFGYIAPRRLSISVITAS